MKAIWGCKGRISAVTKKKMNEYRHITTIAAFQDIQSLNAESQHQALEICPVLSALAAICLSDTCVASQW